MSSEEIEVLLDEYAARFARGDRPDVREFLDRAGAGREELANLIDAFLARANPPEPDAETVELVRAWRSGREPLLTLRTQRGLRIDEVVADLVSALGVDESKRAKVKRCYQQLETGLLEPGRVDRRVYEALSTILQTTFGDLAVLRPRRLQAQAAYFRSVSSPDLVSAPAEEPGEPDEVDALFGLADRPASS